MKKQSWSFVLAMFIFGTAQAQKVYKWEDEQGRVHYSDTAPEKAQRTEVPCPPPPTPQQVDEALQRAQRTKQAAEDAHAARAAATHAASTPATAASLGPLPDNAVSEYMRTLSTGVSCEWREQPRPLHTFTLRVQVRQDVPVGAFLEAEFENPKDPARPLLATATIEATGFPEIKQDSVFFISPKIDTIRCKNYDATVRLYRTRESRELLGIHRQLIQSRMDSALWEAYGEDAFLRFGRQGHLCP